MPTKIIDNNDFSTKGFVNHLAKTLLSEATVENPLKLEFSGFESDPRELVEIPEFVRFIKKLNKQFQGWLTPRIHRDTIKLILTTLTAKGVERQPNTFSLAFPIDPKKWQKHVQSMCCKSEYGLDCAAQLAFICFPEMLPPSAKAKYHSILEQGYVTRIERSNLASTLAEEGKVLLVEYIEDYQVKINIYSKPKLSSKPEVHLIEVSEEDLNAHDLTKIEDAILNKE